MKIKYAAVHTCMPLYYCRCIGTRWNYDILPKERINIRLFKGTNEYDATTMKRLGRGMCCDVKIRVIKGTKNAEERRMKFHILNNFNVNAPEEGRLTNFGQYDCNGVVLNFVQNTTLRKLVPFLLRTSIERHFTDSLCEQCRTSMGNITYN